MNKYREVTKSDEVHAMGEVIDQCNEEIRELKSKLEQAEKEWISVKDKLPKYHERVLVCQVRWSVYGIDTREINMGQRVSTSSNGERWCLEKSSDRLYKPTHWMPLPEPPNK